MYLYILTRLCRDKPSALLPNVPLSLNKIDKQTFSRRPGSFGTNTPRGLRKQIQNKVEIRYI